MLSQNTLDQAADLMAGLRARGWMVATAESCTGGLIAACLTHAAGASDVVDCGFVTYSNVAKTRLLGVAPALIADHGAVSEQVARAMAEGAIERSAAALTISVTGIAGPGGGSPGKPVGLVWFGCALRDSETMARRMIFPGNRAEIREAAVSYGLGLLASRVRLGDQL